jgi:AcrR family transcriptional regulator
MSIKVNKIRKIELLKESPKANDSRELIIQAGLRLLNRLGYGSISMVAIAKEAQMTKQRLTYHFKSPDEILLILAQRWAESGRLVTMEYLANSNLSGVNRIFVMAEATFEWMKKYEELSRFSLVLFQVSSSFSQLAQAQQDTLNVGLQRILGFLKADDYYKSKSEKELLALSQSIHSILMGSVFYILATNQYKNIGLYKKTCMKSLELLLKNNKTF